MESEETWSPLLGRSAELSVLMRLLQRVRSGAPASAFVEGEPGIGKTRLFDETLKRASGFSVFSAHCEELLRDRPFGPLAEALRIDYRSKDPVRSEVAALLLAADDRGPAGPGPELRFRILDALLTLLERSAGEGPVLLGVEDIHWADDSTLLALERIIRGVVGLPLSYHSALGVLGDVTVRHP